MRLPVRLGVVAAAVPCLVLAACSAGGKTANPTATPVHRGGTLRVLDPSFPEEPAGPTEASLDFGVNQDPEAAELLRCCLGRTLLSYPGESTAQGGLQLLPDLAKAEPDVSTDGLQWTFHLRIGLHYAPPLQHTEIVAGDIVRAMERSARLTQYWLPIFSVINGYADFAAGKTSSIAGLETPDAHTLVVRLTQPAGDLGDRLSVGAAVPIPPLPDNPGALYGVATGHDQGDSGFLVSSGPYMIEGADAVDFALPPAQQRDARGFVVAHSLTLVRNPSWHPGDDPLRPAVADRIEIDFTLDTQQAAAAIDAGRADIVMSTIAPVHPPADQVRAYQTDPRRGHVDVEITDGIRYLSMNLAIPPFDDVHVRRAVAYLLDKTALRDAYAGAFAGATIGHLAPDSSEDNALLNFHPFAAPDQATRLERAREEMAQSRYDSTHSGRCDAAVCQHVGLLSRAKPHQPGSLGAIVRADLAPIGIGIDEHDSDGPPYFNAIADPTSHTAAAIGWGWVNDYPNSSNFFSDLFTAPGIAAGGDESLVGTTAAQLHGWGYTVDTVPNVDDRVARCIHEIGGAQSRCWTALDQYLSEQIVPFVPIYAETYTEVVPTRVVGYAFDQAYDFPALDHIGVSR